MVHRTVRYALLLGLMHWLIGARALAQASAEADITLSLRQAQARAARLAPDVQLAAGRVREAKATRVGAGVLFPVNPRLSVDARPGLDAESRGAVGVSSTLDFLMEVGGAPAARVRESSARTRVAAADATVVQTDARLNAMQEYVAERLAGLRIEHAQAAIALGERVLRAALERTASGAASDIDVTSARAELAEYQATLYEAQADQRQSEMALRHLLAIPASIALHLTSTVELPEPAPPLALLVHSARATLPDLAAMRAYLALLASSDQRLRAEAFPKLGAFVGVDASPNSPVFGIVGVSIELPFAQRNQGPRAVVAAQRKTELDRYHMTLLRIELGLRGLRDAYEGQRGALQVLSSDAVPAAEARLNLVEIGWRAGRFDIFRLTAAAQSVVRLRARRIEILARIWHERVLLERLSGGAHHEWS